MATDALRIFGVAARTEATKHWWIVALSGAFPLVSLGVYLVTKAPVRLVLISGLAQSIMLPMLGGAALWFRYRRCDPRIAAPALGRVFVGLRRRIAVGWRLGRLAADRQVRKFAAERLGMERTDEPSLLPARCPFARATRRSMEYIGATCRDSRGLGAASDAFGGRLSERGETRRHRSGRLRAVAIALRRVRRAMGDRLVPLMGVMSACIFSGQMVNFPIPGVPGTSGHLVGGLLAAVVLGPWAGVLAMTVVLVVQCLLFYDGGLTALGVMR